PFDLAFAKTLPAGLAGAYAATVPLRVDVDLSADFAALCNQVETELAVQENRVSYARDAVLRYRALRPDREKMRLPVAVRFDAIESVSPADALVTGSSLTLIVPEQPESIAWAYDRRTISDAAMRRMADRIDVLLASGLQNQATPLAKLDILAPTSSAEPRV